MPVVRMQNYLRAVLAVSVAAAGCVYLLPASPAGADTGYASSAFDAHAQGIAIDATLTNQSLPLGLVLEGAGPEASAHLSSLGEQDAEASFPYLGSVVPGLPGVLAAILGLPVPAYPFEALSGAGDKPSDVNFPGVTLHAESGQTSTVGAATVGNDGAGGATGNARVDVAPDGSVTATSDTAINAVKLGGILTIAGLHSRSVVTADGSTGNLTRTSSLAIGQLSVPGLSIDVPKTTPGSVPLSNPVPGLPQPPPIQLPQIPLPFGGQHLPAPDIGFEDGTFTTTLPGFGTERFAIPAAVVLDAFKALGINMSYQPATKTTTGVEGASFTFTYTVMSPPANQYFSGPTPTTFTLGKANANVTLRPAGGAALPPGDSGSTGGATPVGGSAGSTSVGGTVAPTLGLGNGTTGDASSGGAVSPPEVSPPQPVAAIGTGRQVRAIGRLLGYDLDTSDIYLTFVLVAVAALGSMTMLRLVGVRALWSS